jgi:hypothetical protein
MVKVGPVAGQAVRRPTPPMRSNLLPVTPRNVLIPRPVPTLFSCAMLTQTNLNKQLLHSCMMPFLCIRSITGSTSVSFSRPATELLCLMVTFLRVAINQSPTQLEIPTRRLHAFVLGYQWLL